MAGAQEGDLFLRVAEALDAAARDERQGLQRLQRAARRRQEMRIAGGKEEATVAINDRDRSVVDAVGRVAASDARERNVRRGRGKDGRHGRGFCGSPSFYRGGLAEALVTE